VWFSPYIAKTVSHQSEIASKAHCSTFAHRLHSKKQLSIHLHFSSIGGSSKFSTHFVPQSWPLFAPRKSLELLICCGLCATRANGPRLITPKENQAQKSD
jgi:hypothetical protein